MPDMIRHDIAEHGAKAVVDRPYKAGTWSQVEDRISAGSLDWISLAPALSDGTDAATAEGLGESLIHALPKAPAAVLAVVDLSGRPVARGVDVVCSASFYEGDPTNMPDYRVRAIEAVSRVGDPRLATERQACLERLRASAR